MNNESSHTPTTNYTLIFDVKFPTLNDWTALFDMDEGSDGELFISGPTSGGIGVGGQYDGTVNQDTWYRIGVVCSYNGSTIDMRKFIDGSFVGAQNGIETARFEIGSTMGWFCDNTTETSAGMINSLSYWDEVKDDAFISSLGGPSASGIPVPEPASVILILTALAGLLIRK